MERGAISHDEFKEMQQTILSDINCPIIHDAKEHFQFVNHYQLK